MIRLLADHDFNERILKGLLRREPAVELLCVREIGLSTVGDPVILERAAVEGRIVLTHDRSTMPGFAHARVVAGKPMSGVFLVNKAIPLGQAIDEILLAIHCLTSEECKDVIKYFPL